MTAEQSTTAPARIAKGERSADARERILQAAIASIAEQGYAATSIGQLCERAAIARPSLYWHFGSKEGLLSAVVERVGNDWIRELETQIIVEDGELDPLTRSLSRLDGALAGWRRRVEHEPELLRVLLAISLECSDARPEIRDAMVRFGERAIDCVVRGIGDSLGRELPDVDLVAHTVISLIQGALLRRIIDPEGVDLDRLWDELRLTLVLVVSHRIRETQQS